jgi:hypothetical protein
MESLVPFLVGSLGDEMYLETKINDQLLISRNLYIYL